MAAGSASELDYELLLAKDLGYLLKSDYARIAAELTQVRKMLSSRAKLTQAGIVNG
jgi:four helix bundle protein